MKTQHTSLLLAALLLSFVASAQPDTFYVNALPSTVALNQATNLPSPTEPAKPYWRLKTEAGSRNTQVRFFDADDRLLYEETLSHQYVRLTPRNMARLDHILDRLVNSKLVANSLKAKPLDEGPSNAELTVRAEAGRLAATPTEANPKGYAIRAMSYYQPALNRLIIALTNPDRYRMKITLWQEGRSPEAYFERDNTAECQRKLNLEDLPNGNYKLVVSSIDGNFRYTKPFAIRR